METQVKEQQANSEAPDIEFANLPIEDWVESAERWITDNRALALVGSFALGVFIGVMMKD
jgi:hypothetical protein